MALLRCDYIKVSIKMPCTKQYTAYKILQFSATASTLPSLHFPDVLPYVLPAG